MSSPESSTGNGTDIGDKAETAANRTRVVVVDYTVKAEVYSAYGADFNTEAVNDALRQTLNTLVPDGVVVERNGAVYATPELVERVKGIDWAALIASIDLAQILAEHGR